MSLNFSDATNDKEDVADKISKSLNVDKKAIVLTVVGIITFVLGFFAFNVFPSLLARIFPNSFSDFAKNLLVGIFKSVVFYLFLLSLKIIPAMQSFYRFNGAINAVERCNFEKKENNIKNVAACSEHLSTNFLTFTFFAFIVSFFMLSLIDFRINFFLKILINIIVTLIIFGFCYEIAIATKGQKSLFVKGAVFVFSSLVVCKPSYTEFDVAIAGREELELMEENLERETMEKTENMPMSACMAEVRNALISAGIDDESEAEWLVATVLAKNRTEIRLLLSITNEQLGKIRAVVRRRINHEPLSKIFNFAEFYGFKFFVDKNVLSPRMETEMLCEEAICECAKMGAKRILDMGTGSGAIATVLAKKTAAKIVGVDVSKAAIKVAEKNAKQNDANVEFVLSDMFLQLKKNKKFDIIISNPPYLETNEIKLLEAEVKNFDPMLALDGGEDGLYFYRKLAAEAPDFLNAGGLLMLEISFSKAVEVKNLLKENFEKIKLKKDYFGNDRIVIARKKG
ncbi:MAG: peptide chain release factor N(5)-glutamine methyltransferase [Clostridia bacterium]